GSTSTTGATSTTVTAAPAPASATPTVKKPRKLCAQKPAADGKKLADVKFGHVEATGESPGPDALVTGKGRWTWINLWAGWCGPCKEEMPMLAQWAVALKDKLRFEFVSVDEDERLAVRFLNAQPANGLRASHHLAEGDAKKTWLDSAGIGEITKLPMHVLVDPEGAIRCVITGEVDPGDLDQVKALVGAN
ncbi:MAG TPA: TlpA disulfide reductase family protein, partial [Polyangiaceae bacterium]|nr:TlpA disulfide reductase family protein [Polyangiaceae bacterium]